MDYFCDRISNMSYGNKFDNEEILRVAEEVINELPFLTFMTRDVEFWIKYNSYTQIRFDDGLKSIKREIVLNKILA